jgi:hypothetical protein
LGKRNTKVAIARRLLVTIWYLLSRAETDREADAAQVAQTLVNFAYDVGPEKLPKGQSVREFVREQLDALGIGADLMQIKVSNTKMLALPPAKTCRGREHVCAPKKSTFIGIFTSSGYLPNCQTPIETKQKVRSQFHASFGHSLTRSNFSKTSPSLDNHMLELQEHPFLQTLVATLSQ